MVSEKEYNDFSTKALIDRLYSGSAKNLVASLIGNNKLGSEDIEELRNMFKVGNKNE
jgi:predicted transcriptional regulator